jgi:hypothetical protein
MFCTGDKVVCVNASFDAKTASFFSPLPVRGQIYCVREAGTDVMNGEPVIWVFGIIGREYVGGRERPLRVDRFRKLQSGAVTQHVGHEYSAMRCI